MKKVTLILSLALMTGLFSCTSDMDVASPDESLLDPEVLFSTPQGYKQALAGVYGNLSLTGTRDAGSSFLQGIDAGTSQYGRCLWYLQDLTTDEVVWSYEGDEGVAELQRNTWGAANPILLGMFSRTMAEVALANDFLRQSTPQKLAGRGITNPTDLADIATYRQEVRVLRAMAYYNMMDLFGKAPFYDETSPINSSGPQYDRTQLFTFIESELNAVMPDLKPARTNEYGRLDKAVAQMILAKIYLNAEVYTGTARYADCMTQCNNIIAGGYTLNPNYLYNFTADNHNSSEMIFTLQSDGVVTQNYGATTVIINGEVGSLENNGSALGVGGWGGALRLRKQMVQKFDGAEFSTDTRNTIYAGSRTIDIANISTQSQGFILSKFSNKTSAGVAGINSTFVDTDFPLFRLADVYLMYAEAQMRNDGATNASSTPNADATSLGYINDLRTRANSAPVGAANLAFILDERARELHWEAHRRQDLIRFGKYTTGYNWAWKGNSLNGTSIDEKYKVFPIPANSLKANKNLTQNAGY
ncbi:RagB/SusD family nutrient uptake outer membrane protein [Flavobacterium wongokense]|uniref:RagB/SusD family nutrient uptake outer membrane protein n=1 Tax=Flavobacterium wongokense TaxID=2910674 RepID=UPI001F279875|nr:RagB/SusD family nutrient uptake outer membrane protein [Flavobacterium sp. WG47]MCF6131078.1 RagB/SusD family nutrient uptake outer membrane protein [Flavobacterium sp. WG47]